MHKEKISDAIAQMLKRYDLSTQNKYRNALKEIIQEIVLFALWRAKFFEKAAFYGGTALRILYGLDRFSEDMDFSLLQTDKNFSLSQYEASIKTELQSFGFEVSFTEKMKQHDTPIRSAFLKTNTMKHLLHIGMPHMFGKGMHREEVMQIKFELDTDPPGHFQTEPRYLLSPLPFSVLSFSLGDLFAGKMHALLFREWKNRIKGRDWFDFVWFLQQRVPLHLKHLESRMLQSENLHKGERLTEQGLRELLIKRIEHLDIDRAKEDVIPFVKDMRSIEIWSKEFFHQLAQERLTCS
jgi:hypothetical protein